MSRVAQLVGVALAAGVASYATGFGAGMAVAAVLAAAGAAIMAATLPRATQEKAR